MPDIYQAGRAFKRQLVAGESAAADELTTIFAAAWKRVNRRVDTLMQWIQAERDAGGTVDAIWLYRRDRLQTVIRQIEAELAEFAPNASEVIQRAQRSAIESATAGAQAMIGAAATSGPDAGIGGSFLRTSMSAARSLVGHLADGSPLRDLLDEIGPEASAKIRSELVTGILAGSHPRSIAKRIRRVGGEAQTRALRISRAEILRAYRASTIENYLANSDVVNAWEWLAADDRRTCPVCLAMDGTIHPLTEEMASHVCCRCTMAPVTDDHVPRVRDGIRWFGDQDDEYQEDLLGPGKFALYKSGAIELPDLVRKTVSEKWGAQLSEATIPEALANAARRNGNVR